MILRFRVYEQTISAIASISEPRQGSAEYLQLRITFGKDWENLDRTLWFLDDAGVTEPVSLGQNKNEFVDVPTYFTAQESFRITLTGMKDDQFVPTNEVIISLSESNDLWGPEAPELQPSWVVQYLDLYQHPPIPSDRGVWQLWNPKTQQYELSDIPLPSVTGGLPTFGESYEGKLLYVVGGALVPLKLGPGLAIRNGTLYITGGGGDVETGITVEETPAAAEVGYEEAYAPESEDTNA